MSRTTITVHDRVRHPIPPALYGHFVEELGECIHDGIWAYSAVLDPLPRLEPPLDGVRRDVFAAMRGLTELGGGGRAVLRWPGGCFADSYHWRDGVGPRSERPLRTNAYWSRRLHGLIRSRDGVAGPPVPNHFGTDEFLELCRQLDVEPYINVNYGSGTEEEAAEWVAHARAARERQGVPRVRYWGIANEIWARWETGHEQSAADYARRYARFAAAMRERDPAIELVACGLDPADGRRSVVPEAASWNRELLERCGEAIDLLSLHDYVPTATAGWNLLRRSSRYARRRPAYDAILASPALLRERIERVWADVVAVLGPSTSVRIAFDEWNLWYHLRQIIKANFTLMDGLWVACVLHLLQELAPMLGMANVAQLVNVLGLIRTDPRGVVLTPSYHAFRLVATESGAQALAVTDDGPLDDSPRRFRIGPYRTPWLSIAASRRDDWVSLSIVNRHHDQPVEVRVELDGFRRAAPTVEKAWLLTHPNPYARNTPADREAVVPREWSVDDPGACTVPPHALLQLRLKVD